MIDFLPKGKSQMDRTCNSYAVFNLLDVSKHPSAIMVAWLFATSFAFGQQATTEEVVAKFIAEPTPRGRGPSRSIFEPTVAKLLSHEILDNHNSELRQLLTVDAIDGLARSVSRISGHHKSRGKDESGLALLDQVDEQYERVLADTFNDAGRERLAFEFLRLDGLSAIRRPLVARVLNVDEMTRNKVREAVSPAWESAISMNRAIFEGAAATEQGHQQITDGLLILSKEADRTVLEILTAEQINRLGELLTKFSVMPEPSPNAD